MGDNFFSYLQQLELMAFFSGYPLLYAIVLSIAGKKQSRNNFKSKIVWLLPFSYALVGILYLGLQLKNLYPDYSAENIKIALEHPFLKIWGLLSLLFWIPALSKKTVFSLLHSFVFFFLLLKDFFVQSSFNEGNTHIIKNDMKVYTDSLMINISSLLVVSITYFLYQRIKQNNRPHRPQ